MRILRPYRFPFALATVTALSLATGGAGAAPPVAAPAPSAPAAHSDAGDASESGKLLFRDGDFAGALVKFRLAYQASRSPRFLWNMATCEKNLRHYANVLRLVQQYVREGGDTLSADDRSDSTQLISVLRPLVSDLKVTVDQSDAAVFVDDEQVGTTPLKEPVLVDLGARKIRVTKKGFLDANQSATITGGAGQTPSLQIQMIKESPEGRLVISAELNAGIDVDGRRVGVGHWEGPVASGNHVLRVSAKDKKPYQEDVGVRDGETREMSVTLERESGSKTWMWITGGAVLVAGAGIAGYFLLKPNNDPGQKPAPQAGNFSPGVVYLP